jgi:hypothetical protein
MSSPPAHNRGGAGRHFQVHENRPNVPQHGIDIALVQAAQRKLMKRMASRRMALVAKTGNGHASVRTKEQFASWEIRKMLLDMARTLAANSFATLTEKQRAVATHYLTPEEIARIDALHRVDDATPLGLRYLPKRPPGMK